MTPKRLAAVGLLAAAAFLLGSLPAAAAYGPPMTYDSQLTGSPDDNHW